MNRRIRRLEHELALEQAAPELDVAPIKQRVNASLNVDPSERKAYMRQKIKMTAVLVAAVVALTGTALAVTGNIDALQAFFKGDTSPAAGLLDTDSRSVSDRYFTFTAESSVSDGTTVYLVVRVDALNDDAAKKLMSESFINMDTFTYYFVTDPNEKAPEDIDFDEKYGVHVAGVPDSTAQGWGNHELEDAKTATSRSWATTVTLREADAGKYTYLRARLCYMEADQYVQIPLAVAKSVTVEIGATGEGLPTLWDKESGTLTINKVTLSPFTCQVDTNNSSAVSGAEPRILFRMKDGTLRTQSQMMAGTSSGEGTYNYKFTEVLDLEQLAALVVLDREYPIDGSASQPVAHDPALDPLELPLMSALSEKSGYALPVRALVEGLGGVCVWDNVTSTATLTYRGVTISLTLGSKTALVDGKTVELLEAPGAEGGKLTSGYHVFLDHWGIDLFAPMDTTQEGKPRICWIVIP